MARTMRLGAEMTGDTSGQYGAVVACVDVVLTRDQVRSFVPEDRRLDELELHALWLLRGADELIVHEPNAD